MAKSLRSKVKRSFRNKKREDSVYAATEAARLERLNAKLRNTIANDADGDVAIADEEDRRKDDLPGWSWLATFGLLDAEDVSIDTISDLPSDPEHLWKRRGGRVYLAGEEDESDKENFGFGGDL